MTGYIEDITFLNEKALKFGNEKVEAILAPSLGSNLLSFKYKQKDIEVLRTPVSLEEYKKAPILYGMPILFPPNRIEDGQFTYKGTEYRFPVNEREKFNHIHGFLHDKPWQVCKREVSGKEIIINTEFSSSEFDLKDSFPQDITVNMSLSLRAETLDIKLEITNKGIEPFPWGAGYHTVFNFPFGTGGRLEHCRISLPINKHWELNERSLPTGAIHETADTLEIQNGFSLEGRLFDDLFGYDEERALENECILTDQKAGIQVIYHADQQFKFWVLFNQEGYVCPEPYTWVTNAPNLDLSAKLTGLRELGSGETVQLRTLLSIKDI
ncbi:MULTISPECIES: aldose 1-epimerase [Peribacillus]|uniref:aldose 1-epimerase n=1 Tax=Peribacillus TaxID=2675229 RepID=UPI001F4DAC9D|nr:aldose 1-epimerase [Peribacillus sp. Aquil_B1]MCK2008381.1 aldose 1-epimerase [Peribacillus sp. Aquil_B8]